MRFLISLQPFFFFSGCLMSIIKRDGSEGSTFSKKRVRRFTSFAKAGNWMAAPKRSSFGTRLLTNFLTCHGIFWNLRPRKSQQVRNFRVRSGCIDLVQIRKKWPENWTNAVKNSACNAVVMLKIEARPGCTGTKGCGSTRETNNNKKVSSKLQSWTKL